MEKKTRTLTEEEFNEYHQDRLKLESACTLIADLLDCGTRDADEVLRLIEVHGDEVVDEAREFTDDVGGLLNFGSIIEGIKRVVMFKLRDTIEDDEDLGEDDLDLYDEWINELIIDDNYIAWGGIADYGSCPEDLGEVFSEIMMDGLTDELKGKFIQAFKEVRGEDDEDEEDREEDDKDSTLNKADEQI